MTTTPNVSANGSTVLLSGGVYSLLLKAANQVSMPMNKIYEDEFSSNFDSDLMVDNLKLG